MNERLASMATALCAAEHETTFGHAKGMLAYSEETRIKFSTLAQMALDHIPYLPPEEPEPCAVCGREMPNIPNPMPDMASWQKGHTEGVKAGLKLAIQACLDQKQSFLSTEYATSQPMSSFIERFACDRCVLAIESIMPDSKDIE